ncbi:hypothetical protein BDV93DRAFT_549660 [Ceratobasidium sp. AG-I]|nr:hypothetical protein BDV93DRAFT_549660 [Ceratobasidium sp. AG-I]
MRATGWFTPAERLDINAYLPEMRKLKKAIPLGTLTVDDLTGYKVTVAASLRLRVCRRLVSRHPTIYRNMRDPKVFFRLMSLDSRLKGYFEYKLRDIEAVRPGCAAPRLLSDSDPIDELGQTQDSESSPESDDPFDGPRISPVPGPSNRSTREFRVSHPAVLGSGRRAQLQNLLREKRNKTMKISVKHAKNTSKRFPRRIMSPARSSSISDIDVLAPASPRVCQPDTADEKPLQHVVINVPDTHEVIIVSDSSMSDVSPIKNAPAIASNSKHATMAHPRSSLLRTPGTGRYALLPDLGLPNFTPSTRSGFE